jgi:DnaJ-class molecular chaperone
MSDSLEKQYDNDSFIDYYKILDIDTNASTEEIKKRYIELAKKVHPDQKDGNSDLFQLVSKAYEVLINKEMRKEYDLYFLTKSYNELKEDTFLSLKEQFSEFITINDKKKLTKVELDKLYDDIFKDREEFLEKKLDNIETIKRVNDINCERNLSNIETNDELLKTIIENNPKLDIGEVLEFIKENNKNALCRNNQT